MYKIFIPIYRYFKDHKAMMWILMLSSFLLFAFFALKVQYEEDITKLLPSSNHTDSELAFSSLKVKDKVFIQITSAEASSPLDTYTLGGYADEFIDGLMVRDSSSKCIANVLYRIDDDLPLMAIDYAMNHVPSFVDESSYGSFDKAIEGADEAMERNYSRIMSDMTGSVTQMVSTDPLELRNVLLDNILSDMGQEIPSGEVDFRSMLSSAGAGYSLIDSHLFSPDSTVALIFVSPDFAYFNSQAATVLVNEIEEEVESFNASHPDAKVLVHGAPVRSEGNSHAIKMDLVYTVGASLLIILLAIFISFGGWKIIWQNLLPVIYGAVFALACMYWIKGGMSLMALGLGAIVLGVALSYCLHVVIHHRFVGDVEKMLEDESTPVCLGCITTVGAFLGLLLTKSELLRDFGAFASLALVGNTLFALVFLPHFLRNGETKKNEKVFSLMNKVNSYPYDRKPVLLVLMTALVVVGFIFSPKVQFDSNLKNIGYESVPFKESEALYADKINGGKMQRYYASAAPTLDEALEGNKRIVAALDSLKRAGVSEGTSPLLSVLFVPSGVQESRIDAWNQYWTPEKVDYAWREISRSARKVGLDPEMFAPFRAMVTAPYYAESLYDSGILPEGLLCNFIEESEGRFLVFNSVKMDSSEKGAVDKAVASLPHAVVIDPLFYTSDMIQIVHEDFNLTLSISSIFVLIVLLLSFLNLWSALLAFLPMFLSWYVVQGLMAIFGLQFNLINIVVSTFVFGIGVDYSIFVMRGLLAEARGEGSDLLDYHKAAIVFSAFVLVVVVVSLLFAVHPAISSIGVCTLIGMASTILITYTLQPFVFRMLLKVPFIRKSFKVKSDAE